MDSVITLNRTGGDGDPNRPTLEKALERVEEAAAAPLSSTEKLLRMAQASGDISDIFTPEKLAEIGSSCVDAFERDRADRKPWEDTAREAIAAVREAGGDVIAEAALVDRSGGTADLGVPFVPLIRIDVPTYDADSLPAELASIPAVKPGSRASA